jgi:hypothetical protein
MVSTVMRPNERKETYETHIVVGEGSRPGTDVLSRQQDPAVRSRTNPENLSDARVVEDRTTTRRANGGTAADAHSRNAPVR